MNIVYKKLDQIMPYERNPRANDKAVNYVADSIKEFGFKNPIIIDAAGVIVCGHTRYKAAKQLGMEEVPCIMADDLTPYQIQAYRLADNKVSEYAEWDFDLLEQEIEALSDEFDMEDFGFNLEDLNLNLDPDSSEEKEEPWLANDPETAGNLVDRYIVPPFSVLDTRAGYWQKRKDDWINSGINSGDGRDVGLIGSGGLYDLAQKASPGTRINGTSVFDPVLTEIMYKWFCPPGGSVYDCFAGGSVRGAIAKILGHKYTGIELRPEQVEANEECAQKLGIDQHWICDDSLNADNYLADKSVDFFFTCPPYGDLEKYSDDPRDISNMSYEDFLSTYREILSIGCRKVKDDRFAAIVVGDIRDKNGYYRGLVDSTIEIMKDNGFQMYNDMILLNQIASAAVRVNRPFNSNRKVVNVHQRVLVFYRGDVKKIREYYPELDFSEIEGIEE